ncbi:MAG: FecR domain-containing protein [Gammaproteobacteria bacterium]|nr:FecR domain-containing protein [Gammaproteobacteria bacterium]MDH3429004.1 FecR domain-containing protein [Gammaproteobacteria bacterium]MDH3434191.1 FecR domain-containing protein [Gammaproteobacteria bacterium]
MTVFSDLFGQDIPEIVLEDAATWMAMLDSDSCNAADQLAFARWLDEDLRHRLAFEELSEVWARLKTLADVEPLMERGNIVRLQSAASPGAESNAAAAVSGGSGWSAIAATVIIALGVAMHLVFSVAGEELATEVGESRHIVLNDGSMLEMNARTTMQVVIDDSRREVQMSRGEAVFHVASDSRPFVVRTAMGTIAALGTTFNVEVDNELLEVSVIEGQVSVMSNESPLPLTEYDGDVDIRLARSVAHLGAGEWLEVSGSTQRQRVLGTEEFRKRLSWRSGVVSFEEQPLQAVVEEMRRYNHVSIHVADSALSGLKISGEFKTGDTRDFLDRLRDEYGIVVDDRHVDWIVLRSR